jgi:UDP-N-acetylglucosamine 1-carboxyvinyltransferase
VELRGAKNAALPIMAAAIAADGPLTLHNVPDLVDIRTQVELLRRLGVDVERTADRTYRLQAGRRLDGVAPYDLVRRMRASICVLGPLLARRGCACVSLPGGCAIGHRPIDLHLKGLAALGADVRMEQGYVVATARRLRGATIDLAGPRGSTVTGTCNVMTAAALARGTTIIRHAAREPEVEDLARCLNRLGGRISGAGSSTLVIDGVEVLGTAEHTILPDRIEAATLMCAAVMTGGAVQIRRARTEHLTAVSDVLQRIGASVHCERDRLTVAAAGELRPLDVVTRPYPGLPTDVQAQLTAVLTQAAGVSRVTETVFPDRFRHVSELMRLGAEIRRDGESAIIRGPTPLCGAEVTASDLRASAALVLAGLAASGTTVVRRIDHLDRGYERLEERLRQLGGDVIRTTDVPAGSLPRRPRRPAGTVVPPPHLRTSAIHH